MWPLMTWYTNYIPVTHHNNNTSFLHNPSAVSRAFTCQMKCHAICVNPFRNVARRSRSQLQNDFDDAECPILPFINLTQRRGGVCQTTCFRRKKEVWRLGFPCSQRIQIRSDYKNQFPLDTYDKHDHIRHA